MSERLTTEQIEAIKARRAAITDTSWKSDCGHTLTTGGRLHVCSVVNQNEHTVARLIPYEHYAVFIAHAPDDIDALLAEVERVTEQRDGLGTQVTHLQEQLMYADREIERQREVITELEAPREGILADAQARQYELETLDKAEREIEKMLSARKRTSRDALNELKVLMQERGDIIGGIAPAVNPAAGQDGD